jgi:hypothetical protein
MYRDGLGLSVLGDFSDREGFDGVMLGSPNAIWHLEFTQQKGACACRVAERRKSTGFLHRRSRPMENPERENDKAGFRKVSANNPYWDRLGVSFEDPDAYRVVLYRGSWGLSGPCFRARAG